ncbi:Glycosyltransferase involved in cell wall bisynthesis [Prevotella sp. tc2-28]|uniref:glycosyltransferase family 2 protein n=1 Tax=Prevotella sp. tc2-28 TaxID=1761888 RepID=UPI000896415D|nr:glycosyltransferase family 2 protein [Prevotella sp. tc2-28]SEA52031.1 Glycosyltransferase involved in cell wall bisynthesis [Prevotella sp. tc2-28]
MEKLLTIVIPAYNMESLLPRCLDSICIEKVMDRVQVLIVNDGSKDKTLEIAQTYESRYPHYFTVVDKPNGNYGSCMNVGLSCAEGKYFRTLDADDWYDSKSYEKFVDELEKTDADMLLCERKEFYEARNCFVDITFNKDVQLNKDLIINKKFWGNDSIKANVLVPSICYKTSILRECNMKWTENAFYTDTEYDYFPLALVKTIRFIPLTVYIYLIGRNEQSISSESIKKNFRSFYLVTKRIISNLVESSQKESEVYPLQEMHSIRILRFIYQSLLIQGIDYANEIKEIDEIVSKDILLYERTNKIDVYRNYYYVDAYRHNKLKFMLIYTDYKLRRFLHKLFKEENNPMPITYR